MKTAVRRGITPVVAIALLLGMTVTASGGAYAWITTTTQQAQQDTSQSLSTSLAVRDVRCEGSIAVLTVTNTGDTALTGGSADIYLHAGDELRDTASVDLTGADVLQPGGLTTLHVPFDTGMTDGLHHRVELRMPDSGAAASAPCQATSGLTSYYRFEEGGGTWANDSVGPNHGRLYNGSGNVCAGGPCPTWTTGVRGGALDFDGAHDYVHPSWNPPADQSLTYAAWYQRDGSDGVVIGANPGCHSAPSLWVDGGGDLTFEVLNTDDTCIRASTPGSAGSWIHAVGVADAATGEIRLYMNGSLVDQAQGWDGNTDGGTLVGNDDPTNPELDLDGRIDELQIHDRALTAAQVEALYEATKP